MTARQLYEAGMTVQEVARETGKSVGKTFYILRDSGTVFRKRGIPEGTHDSTFDGMHGYGHTKAHQQGYILAYAPGHPHARKDGYVMMHTVIAERMLGRYLKPDEVAHHINHIRTDNRPENIRVMDRHEHLAMHARERRKAV